MGEEASLSFESYFALGLVDSAKPGLRLYLLERGQDFCIVFFPYCLEDYEIVDLDGSDIELRLAATRHIRTRKYVCLFIGGPVSRPTTHSRNCWLQGTSAEFASWVLAQLGICSPGLTHHCDLECLLLRDDCVRPCLATLAMTLFLASVSHQWSLATSKSHVERNPPHG